jgi:hypothetical protein
MRLDLTAMERRLLDESRALATDPEGREVFVGLNWTESREYARLITSGPHTNPAREIELSARHEAARAERLLAENDARKAARKQ